MPVCGLDPIGPAGRFCATRGCCRPGRCSGGWGGERYLSGWRPEFFDYLYLGFTNATAFSPTDVMSLARWAKAAMTVQATGSLVILGLVIARAVNILQ